jgi:hypothetical protein
VLQAARHNRLTLINCLCQKLVPFFGEVPQTDVRFNNLFFWLNFFLKDKRVIGIMIGKAKYAIKVLWFSNKITHEFCLCSPIQYQNDK